jgi:hypothetical protein
MTGPLGVSGGSSLPMTEANRVIAGPEAGPAAKAAPRLLTVGDLPDLSAIYSPVAHNHDLTYAALDHNHDLAYSPLGHDHALLYSPLGHYHDLTYSLLGHNHDDAYSLLGHTHTRTWPLLAPTTSADNVIQPTGAAVIPFTVKGAAAQSANLQEWQDSAGAVLTSVDSAGRVGIGTTAPGYKLDIAGTGDLDALRISTDLAPAMVRIAGAAASNTGYLAFTGSTYVGAGGVANRAVIVQHPASGAFIVQTTTGVELFRANTTGVGIGTMAPTVALDVYGQAKFASAVAGTELTTDGDMEAADATAWPENFAGAATITKETGTRPGGTGTKVLRVIGLAGGGAAHQAILTSGKAYRVRGWTRSGGVTAKLQLCLNNVQIYTPPSASSTWVYFDVTGISDGTALKLRVSSANGEYIEVDDLSVIEVSQVVVTDAGNIDMLNFTRIGRNGNAPSLWFNNDWAQVAAGNNVNTLQKLKAAGGSNIGGLVIGNSETVDGLALTRTLEFSDRHAIGLTPNNVIHFVYKNADGPAKRMMAIDGKSGGVFIGSRGSYADGTWLPGLQAVVADAITAAVTNVLTLGHNSSGTPAAGFGAGILFQLESTTTENRDAGGFDFAWSDPTDASRSSRFSLSLVSNGTLVQPFVLSRDPSRWAMKHSGSQFLEWSYGWGVHIASHSGIGNVWLASTITKVAVSHSKSTTPSSALDVNGDVEVGDANAYLMGPPDVDGSWRIVRSGNDLQFQRREGGAWVNKGAILA